MLVTRRMDYGLRIMMTLGLRAGERLTGEELAKAAGASRAFVVKIVGQLARAGLVRAWRGVGGGVELGKPADQISLFDILRAADEPRAINPCLIEPRACSRSRACAVHRALLPIQKTLDDGLRAMSLAELVKRQRAAERERVKA